MSNTPGQPGGIGALFKQAGVGLQNAFDNRGTGPALPTFIRSLMQGRGAAPEESAAPTIPPPMPSMSDLAQQNNFGQGPVSMQDPRMEIMKMRRGLL